MAPSDRSNLSRLMVIGAHPDDAEFGAGGLMVRWRQAGGEVLILSLTDGSAGHNVHSRTTLARIRTEEARASAAHINASVQVWQEPDGELSPTLSVRHRVIAVIRKFQPDVIVTHRTADYHPDHRATGQLVQDACYLLRVPNVVPDAAPLGRDPVVLLMSDRFSQPRPFRADWLVPTDDVFNDVVAMLNCHASQVYEWLPHMMGVSVPSTGQQQWLADFYRSRPQQIARDHAANIKGCSLAEAFEVSEYGGRFRADDYAWVVPNA